jgi:hypothetical protein
LCLSLFRPPLPPLCVCVCACVRVCVCARARAHAHARVCVRPACLFTPLGPLSELVLPHATQLLPALIRSPFKDARTDNGRECPPGLYGRYNPQPAKIGSGVQNPASPGIVLWAPNGGAPHVACGRSSNEGAEVHFLYCNREMCSTICTVHSCIAQSCIVQSRIEEPHTACNNRAQKQSQQRYGHPLCSLLATLPTTPQSPHSPPI